MYTPKNKIYTCLKEEIKKPNNIIFLDIDGVIQPYKNQYRFKHDLDELQKMLYKKYNDKIYLNIDKYDLGACYYDWDESSIGLIKELLKKTKSHLVIHSGWKDVMPKSHLFALFKIYELDEYIIDILDKGDKQKVIHEYIKNHKIDKFLIIDDLHFEHNFGFNFYLTYDHLNEKDYDNILYYFKNDYIIKENDNEYLLFKNKNLVHTFSKFKIIDDIYMLDISKSKLSNIEIYFAINELLKINHNINNICILDNNRKEIFEKFILNSHILYGYNIYFLDTLYKGYKFIKIFNENENIIFDFIKKYIKNL